MLAAGLTACPHSSIQLNMTNPRRRNQKKNGRRPTERNVTITRRDFLGAIPPGTGDFVSTTLAAYPQEATIVAIARSFAEYRYTSYRVSLVPASSSSTTGNGFVGFSLSPPTELTSLAACASLQGFRAGPGYALRTGSGLDTRGRARRWLRVIPTDLTPSQLLDPDIVQAWPVVGSQGVQSGVRAWNVFLDFTIQFRGNVPPPGPQASVSSLTPAVSSEHEDQAAA